MRNRKTSFVIDGPRCLSIAEIQQAVARAFGVSVSEMLSRRRMRHVARARQAAMYLCRELGCRGQLGYRRQVGSFPRIGLAFARDHTSVIHACKAVARRRLYDFELAGRLDEVVRELSRPPALPPIEPP
jgi:chromosomal replication initiator protein